VDFENQGVRATTVSYSKAPNRAASETVFKALGKVIGSGREFFDGSGGGEVYTFTPAETYAGKRLDDVKLSSDFYSQLDWKTNYKKVEVKGTAKVGGEDAWIVSFEPQRGTPFREYYSTRTFLLLKRDGVITSSTSQQTLPYSIVYSDYRNVDGVMTPFKVVTNSVSNGNIVTTITSVKQNVPIDDKVFSPKKLK
jgi:hypothetical protein